MDFLKQNSISIIIAVAGILTTYSVNTALYGYRLTALEERMDRQGLAITTLQTENTDTLVALAQIQTKLEYITTQLNKIVP